MPWQLLADSFAVPWPLATALISVVLFLILHLAAAIWFASRINTEVGLMRRAIEHVESDVRSLLAIDARLKVVESRVDDLREQWRKGRWVGSRAIDDDP